MAQKAISIQGKKVKDGVIYLTFNGKELEYFTTDNTADSKKTIQETTTFSLKDDNSCNIYLKWINPLKYKLTWKDTTYVDERDKAIDDFVDLLTSQFGSTVTSLNKSENAALTENSRKGFLRAGATELLIPEKGFNNTDLTLLYIQLRSNQSQLSDTERKELNVITKSIIDLDAIIATDIFKKVDAIFTELVSLNEPTNVANKVAENETEIEEQEKLYAQIDELQKSIIKSLTALELTDKLLNSYSKTIISKFIDQTVNTTNSNKQLTAKLKPILEILKNSIKEESANATTKGFYKSRSLGFEDGKKIKAEIRITEFEYNNKTKEFSKKSDILNKSLVFQKYDFFAISVSTGLFYSNTTLKGYGVANGTDGQFAVTEEDITKNSAVTAVFLNFNFGVGSRYLAPLAQIGIDPTKKRPFLLLGGGFSIPSASIAFTGGPIWTWSPTLDKLSVGQAISSTTELENDIQYKFDMEPKGWYLGIQYNF
ncbi:hypothetical protein GOQ30_03285 [Flavobacterium sp. TP390]|uniref:Uncharacterized protein n=1 Tax=Flavobacterium profundi TaxID=1774945 RepID=A0A6I4IF45_9FLAO|nr:hypothetical protein [Flavobacterium profundi]MVO08188.1 hypothetical protein [Flavobacterium profundi]